MEKTDAKELVKNYMRNRIGFNAIVNLRSKDPYCISLYYLSYCMRQKVFFVAIFSRTDNHLVSDLLYLKKER